MRRLTLTLVPALLLACGDEPAGPDAVAPQFARRSYTELIGPFDVSGQALTGFAGESCADFDILRDYSIQIRHNTHYDKEGNVAREEYITHWVGPTRLYNATNPGVELYSSPGEVQNSHWDRVNGWLVSALSVLRVIVPGVGPIVMETGAWRIEIATWTLYHDSGQNFLWEGDFDALCAALTP